jgi:hypothetical protein
MTIFHEIEFGRSYTDESRKQCAGWIWRCACDECRGKPDSKRRVYGPFKTEKAGEQGAKQTLTLHYGDCEGAA